MARPATIGPAAFCHWYASDVTPLILWQSIPNDRKVDVTHPNSILALANDCLQLDIGENGFQLICLALGLESVSHTYYMRIQDHVFTIMDDMFF